MGCQHESRTKARACDEGRKERGRQEGRKREKKDGHCVNHLHQAARPSREQENRQARQGRGGEGVRRGSVWEGIHPTPRSTSGILASYNIPPPSFVDTIISGIPIITDYSNNRNSITNENLAIIQPSATIATMPRHLTTDGIKIGVGLSLPSSLVQRIDALRGGTSRSEFLASAIKAFVLDEEYKLSARSEAYTIMGGQ